MSIFLHSCRLLFQRSEFTGLTERLKAMGASHVIKEETLRRPEMKELFKVYESEDD